MGRGGFQKPSWFELKVAAVVSSSLFNGRGQVRVSPDVGTGSQSPRTGPSGPLSSSSMRKGRENAKAAVKKKASTELGLPHPRIPHSSRARTWISSHSLVWLMV